MQALTSQLGAANADGVNTFERQYTKIADKKESDKRRDIDNSYNNKRFLMNTSTTLRREQLIKCAIVGKRNEQVLHRAAVDLFA